MSRLTTRVVALMSSAFSWVAAAQTTAIQDVTPMRRPVEVRPIEDRRLPGVDQVNGEAKWTTELAQQIYAFCPGDAIVDALESGSSPTEADDSQAGNCARNTLFVRNTSQLIIQCKALLEYAVPDHSGNTRLEIERVIFPGTEDAAFHSYANASTSPKAVSARCFAIPAGPLAPLGNPPECRPEFQGPPADDFYPASSRRRDEQGSVVLEFVLTADSVPADVRVAASSGFAELDSAALKYAKYLHAKSTCVGAHARVKVRFAIAAGA